MTWEEKNKIKHLITTKNIFMKRIYTLYTFIFLICAVSLTAQERYIDEVFETVSVTSDVTYGVNATVLFVPVTGEADVETLKKLG